MVFGHDEVERGPADRLLRALESERAQVGGVCVDAVAAPVHGDGDRRLGDERAEPPLALTERFEVPVDFGDILNQPEGPYGLARPVPLDARDVGQPDRGTVGRTHDAVLDAQVPVAALAPAGRCDREGRPVLRVDERHPPCGVAGVRGVDSEKRVEPFGPGPPAGAQIEFVGRVAADLPEPPCAVLRARPRVLGLRIVVVVLRPFGQLAPLPSLFAPVASSLRVSGLAEVGPERTGRLAHSGPAVARGREPPTVRTDPRPGRGVEEPATCRSPGALLSAAGRAAHDGSMPPPSDASARERADLRRGNRVVLWLIAGALSASSAPRRRGPGRTASGPGASTRVNRSARRRRSRRRSDRLAAASARRP